MKLSPDRSKHTSSSRGSSSRSSEIEIASKVLCSARRVGLITRERVGVSIHQDCGSYIMIPFLDCDTVGSECIDQEEVRTTSETVYECKDKTNNAFLHETPRQISNRLFT